MQIRLLEEAQRRFESEDAWWRSHRDSKDLFADEFEATLGWLQTQHEVGQHYRRHRSRLIQRVLMSKTRCYVYYFVDQARGVIEIHSIWGARRGRGPTL